MSQAKRQSLFIDVNIQVKAMAGNGILSQLMLGRLILWVVLVFGSC
ncbi:conserved hypothetical protein [Alteromonas infernus]